MKSPIPHPIQALVDDLKQINTGAVILANRLDERLVLVELRQALTYDLSALRQDRHRQLSVNNLIMGPIIGKHTLCYFWIDLTKLPLHRSDS